MGASFTFTPPEDKVTLPELIIIFPPPEPVMVKEIEAVAVLKP